MSEDEIEVSEVEDVVAEGEDAADLGEVLPEAEQEEVAE